MRGRAPRRRVAVVELDEHARRALARRYAEVHGLSSVLAVATTPDAGDELARAVRELAHAVEAGERARVERLVEALLPPLEVPPPAVLERARREAALRLRILRDFGALTGRQLGEVDGASAARLARRRAVFAVPFQGVDWYLGFQFDERGRPLPVVGAVLRALRDWPPWEIAAWFVYANPALGRRRPVDVMREDPEAVVAAATHDGAARREG